MVVFPRTDPARFIGRHWSTLPSPGMVVKLSKVVRNTQRMQAIANQNGVSLRPHVKTHKTPEAARLQLAAQAHKKIVVSTIEEAYYFAEGGFNDILYGVPISEDKLPSIAALVHAGVTMHVLVDCAGAVPALRAAAAAWPAPLSVFIKVDTGYHRAGVGAKGLALELARLVVAAAPALRFGGLYSHSGHAYEARCCSAAAAVGGTERDVIVDFARELRSAGIEVPVVSIGSTPACSAANDMGGLEGVTEMHPGNYTFYDRQQVATGACSIEDVAAYVLTRVISHHPTRNTLLIDAGGLAFSKDTCPQGGMGEVEDHPRLLIARASQEESVVQPAVEGETLDYALYPLGMPLLVRPNHACLAAACHPVYYVVDDNGMVVEAWRPTRGW